MILTASQFEYLSVCILKVDRDIKKIIESGVLPKEILYIVFRDYSTEDEPSFAITIRIDRKIELPKSVAPMSIQTYTNMEGEEYTDIRYIFDTDKLKD